MRHLALRTTLTATVAAGALAAMLTACGGGGSSTTPQTAPAPTSSINPNLTVNNFTGPSAPITVSLKVPPRTEPSAAFVANIKKLYGAYRTDPHLREMSNTAASPAMRALGLQVHSNALKVEQATRRDPTFIPGATEYLEIVVSDAANDTVYVDSMDNGCSSGSCTATVNAPVGTNMNVTLYLYDDCGFVIAAGTASGVPVTLGNTTPVTVTLNGVVAHFSFSSNAQQPFLADPSGAVPSFNVTVAAYDWDSDLITSNTTPVSYLLDSNFDQITGVTMSVQNATDITTAQTFPIAPAADLSFAPVVYSFGGTVPSEGGTTAEIVAAEVPGSQIVPDLNHEGGTSGTDNGIYDVAISATQLNWTNPEGYPQAATDPLFTNVSSGVPTESSVEFPLATNTGTYEFGIDDQSTVNGSTITITSSNCGGIVASSNPAFGIGTAYSTVSTSPYVQITMGSSAASNSCVLTATDGTLSSQLYIYTDQSSLTIQNKARKP